MSDGGEIQSAYLSGQGRALFQMCSSKENISVDVIVRKKKLYELSEHFMEIDREHDPIPICSYNMVNSRTRQTRAKVTPSWFRVEKLLLSSTMRLQTN
ncbi:hypothetical protein IGI04_020272 [Brassica rapa subsp. trilocularis]|uniref:Uncharacterized protein n=1 Tax=Brassica rapa subsp. trilocularis TaxID=1813537 RepID=A0ABQ7MJW0_BRACM|nr:hypothetical protein IGI04_020272 [Brassica rapa subsp. trilocularis]